MPPPARALQLHLGIFACLLLATLPGCGGAAYFDCSNDAACVLGDEAGRCFAGECGYEDDSCMNGYRYPAQARPPLAGTCVDMSAGTGTAATTDPSTTTAATSTSPATGPVSTDGDSTASTGPDPATSTGPADPACDVDEISGGDGFTCARQDGDVYCWGANDLLQLGSEGASTAVPRKVDALDDAVVVALGDVGDSHACATTDEGVVWCWGEQTNSNVIGSGRPAVFPPTQVGIAGARRAGAGDNFSCAQLGSNVTCWGDTFWGQTGVMGGSGFNVTLTDTPLTTLRQGALHSCAVLERGGTVLCWGADDHGQLGRDGDAPRRPVAEPDPQPPVGLPGDVQALALGGRFSCALEAGGVWCWGTDSGGELLGTGASSVPKRLEQVPEATDIAAGEQFACALTTDDRITCWGLNSERQVDPLNDASSGLSDVTAALETVTGESLATTRLGAGREHACAIGDHVVCWGRGEEGQLGDDAVTGTVAYVSLPGCARE